MSADYFYGDVAGYEAFSGANGRGCSSRDAFGYALFKRVFDVVAALGGLLLIVPLFPFIALLIKLETPGPVFFRQRRVGRCGRLFDCFKFRSMAIDA